MKKIVALLLTLCLIFSAMPMQAFAIDPDLSDELERYSRVQRGSDDFKKIIKWHEDELDLEYFDQMQKLKAANSMSFMKGFAITTALANGIYTLLQNCGVIEDPHMAAAQNILDVLADIQDTVKQIDKKTDDIQTTLASEFSNIEYQFSLLEYDKYQKAWTDFFTNGSYKEMNDWIDSFNSQVNNDLLEYAKSWQSKNESGIRALYNGSYEQLVFAGDNMNGSGEAIPTQPKRADGSDSLRINSAITLPGEYITIDKVRLTADNFEQYLSDAIEAGVLSAANEGKLLADDSFYTEWNAMADAEKAPKAKQIAADLVNSLHYEVIHRVANSPKAGMGSFASQFKSKYDAFCNTFTGSKDIISPMYAAYMKLTATHAFEGETVNSLVAYASYLGTLAVEYGTYAKMITALDDGMALSNKEKVEKMDTYTNAYILYCLDNFLTGYGNYCYPLNALVEYHDALLVSEVEAKDTGTSYVSIKSTIPWSVVDSQEYSINQTAEEKQAAIGHMSGLLSARDVSLLYYYYQENGAGRDFITYLDNNNAVKADKAEDEEYPTAIITSGFASNEDYKIDKNNSMKFHLFGYSQKGSPYSEFENNEFNLFPETAIFRYDVHDQAVGTVFDASAGSAGAGSVSDVNGRIRQSTQLAARAVGNMDIIRGLNMNTAFVFADGVYSKTASVPGYDIESLGVDSSGAFADATYTVSTGYPYGALVIVPMPVEEEEAKTASVFSSGNVALVCGGAALVCAAGFAGGFLVGKKKKRED